MERLKGTKSLTRHLDYFLNPEALATAIQEQDVIRMKIIHLLMNLTNLGCNEFEVKPAKNQKNQISDWRKRFNAQMGIPLSTPQILEINEMTDCFLFGKAVEKKMEEDPQYLIDRIGINENITELLLEFSSHAIYIMNETKKKVIQKYAESGEEYIRSKTAVFNEMFVKRAKLVKSLPIEALYRVDLPEEPKDLLEEYEKLKTMVKEYYQILIKCGANVQLMVQLADMMATSYLLAYSYRTRCNDRQLWDDLAKET